jgi:16S rRNA (guanine1207-N2)-methyltransferase
MNIKKYKSDNNAFYSDTYSEVKDTYDIIITNPPIRVGNDKLLEILIDAKKHLNEKGELWYVIRKDQGGLTIMKRLESIYNIEIKGKKKGYIIFLAKNK